jgi:hypothetical protein
MRIASLKSAPMGGRKAKGHGKRLAEGKPQIIDNYEFLNKAKLNAATLLDLKIGYKYKVSKDGKTISRILTPSSLAEIQDRAVRMGTAAIKAEIELAGDDPESRKAEAIEQTWAALVKKVYEEDNLKGR